MWGRSVLGLLLLSAGAKADCLILGAVTLKKCPEPACSALGRWSTALLTGQSPDSNDVFYLCQPPRDYQCLEDFFGSSLVQGALPPDLTQEVFCYTPAPPVCDLLGGVVKVPNTCYGEDCSQLNIAAGALAAGGLPSQDVIHWTCSRKAECLDPFFADPIVQGAAGGMTTADFCGFAPKYECKPLGLIPLPDCHYVQCAAITRILTEPSATPQDIQLMCDARESCALPLFDNNLVKAQGEHIDKWCGTPAPNRQQPTNCVLPSGDGTFEECSATQEETGLKCCDDVHGELAAVNTTCEEVSIDVANQCKMDVNDRLYQMYLCPIDDANGTRRKVEEVCPKRCKYTKTPGCECPASYDKGCPALQCFVPDDEVFDWGVKCADCETYGMTLRCTDPDTTMRTALLVVLIVMLVVILGILVGYTAHEIALKKGFTQKKPAMKRRRPSLLEGGVMKNFPGGAVRAMSGCFYFFERYRLAFERMCWRFGFFLSAHRVPFFTCFMLLLVALAVCGLPQAEIDRNPSGEDWAPEGSELQNQLKFWTKWTSSGKVAPTAFMMVGYDDNRDAITQEILHATWRIFHLLRDINVPCKRSDGNGTFQVGYEDFCLRIPETPAFEAIYPGEKPCIQPGPLDCFFEGTWQIENTTGHKWPDVVDPRTTSLESAVAILNGIFGATDPAVDNYRGRPSYMDLNNDQIRARISEFKQRPGGCYNWATGFSMPRNLAVGGGTENVSQGCPRPDPKIKTEWIYGKFLAHLIWTEGVENARESRPRLQAASTDELIDARDRYEDAITDELERIDNDEVNFPGIRVSVIWSTFQEDVIKELASAQFLFIIIGYALMGLVLLGEVSCTNQLENLFWIGLIYYAFIMTSATGAAFGVIALADQKYTHLMLQVLPYLAIGLGVDDMFLLLHYFRKVKGKETRSSHEIVADLMHGGGRSVTLTSLTNFLTFFGGTLTPISALRNYLILGGLIVLFNYISAVICLPLMLSYWTDHFTSKNESVPTTAKKEEEAETFEFGERVVVDYYAPALLNRKVQIGLVLSWVIFVVFCSIALLTFAPLTVDFDITDFAPSGTYLARSVADFQDNFVDQSYRHSWYAQCGPNEGNLDLTDPIVQEKLQITSYRLGFVPEINDLTDDETDSAMKMWLFRFYEFVEANEPQSLHKKWASNNTPAKTACSKACLIEANDNKTVCELLGECVYYQAGQPWYVEQSRFYELFHTWRHIVDGGIDSLAALAYGSRQFGYKYGDNVFNPEPGCQEAGCNDTNVVMLFHNSITVDSRCISSPKEWKDHTDEMTNALQRDLGEKVWMRPTGPYYDTVLYSETTNFFWTTLAISVAGVFVAGVVVPVSLSGALFVAASGLASTIELTALLMMAGISFTQVIAVSIIMAIGLSVDPVVHVVSAYEHCLEPGRPARLRHAIRYATLPVLKSGISTIISFIMMAASPFPYVIKYSFLPLLISILISLVHGVLWIPALLGLFGSNYELDDLPTSPGATGPMIGNSPQAKEMKLAGVAPGQTESVLMVQPIAGAQGTGPGVLSVQPLGMEKGTTREAEKQKQTDQALQAIEEKRNHK
eukprot:Hpha_TRINITY_DN16906_c1_g7::TRINITY_DN16906_c1_g7_i2::g.55240::m.55240/K06225/PTCH1; patched 1